MHDPSLRLPRLPHALLEWSDPCHSIATVALSISLGSATIAYVSQAGGEARPDALAALLLLARVLLALAGSGAVRAVAGGELSPNVAPDRTRRT
jgi:hypothetical protein